MIPEIPALKNAETFAFSAENKTGSRNGGSHALPHQKLSPCVSIDPGKTVTLLEMDDPGMIQSMWFGGNV